MTHPTKAIFYTLVSDFANLSGEDALFSRKDVEAAMERIEVVDFDQTIMVDGIQVSGYQLACFAYVVYTDLCGAAVLQ
jgi:cleavage and polyadenylation specificity factor subunit 3